ncbi:uncharacterized protein C7orf50 homolog isoform X4 [Bubalus bubalis]|uniref:uncharacterized protein C7orf50 homolog isoform X4 n=1 Tax=Bubalus bubalis TaxID=89462 RepID=UPI001E1B83C6|nr:uncharacterized protein C7orf50 homolog isoform X4 [Bubalus bubalis]
MKKGCQHPQQPGPACPQARGSPSSPRTQPRLQSARGQLGRLACGVVSGAGFLQASTLQASTEHLLFVSPGGGQTHPHPRAAHSMGVETLIRGLQGVCIRVPVPGGAEGPGEKAEEGAEERSTEAAAGGGHRCGSKPCSQALRGRAGPGVPVQVPDEHFPALLAYLEGLRGRARELTVQKAEALMRELDEAGAVALPPGGTQRARQVLQLLS